VFQQLLAASAYNEKRKLPPVLMNKTFRWISNFGSHCWRAECRIEPPTGTIRDADAHFGGCLFIVWLAAGERGIP
jgi:hypothetical protein